MSAACAHSGDQSRTFDGSIVCEDCRKVIGDWRTDEGAEQVVLPAVERPEIGSGR